jgi:flagellar hook assembly protein FlgD
VPSNYRLEQNSPNPFQKETMIVYALPKRSFVTLEVVDQKGKLVRELIRKMQEPGEYDVYWGGEDDAGGRVSEGRYLCRMTAWAAGGGAFMQSRLLERESEDESPEQPAVDDG